MSTTHATQEGAKAGNVSVNIGSSASPAAPGDTSAGSGSPLLAWWPVILFALTIAFASGASFWQTRANADSIKEIRTDVRSLLRFHGVQPPAKDTATASR